MRLTVHINCQFKCSKTMYSCTIMLQALCFEVAVLHSVRYWVLELTQNHNQIYGQSHGAATK